MGSLEDPIVIIVKGNGSICTWYHMKIQKEFLKPQTSFAASNVATYSALVVESTTQVCFTLLQQMASLFRV